MFSIIFISHFYFLLAELPVHNPCPLNHWDLSGNLCAFYITYMHMSQIYCKDLYDELRYGMFNFRNKKLSKVSLHILSALSWPTYNMIASVIVFSEFPVLLKSDIVMT